MTDASTAAMVVGSSVARLKTSAAPSSVPPAPSTNLDLASQSKLAIIERI
jgi:hypothetical protein